MTPVEFEGQKKYAAKRSPLEYAAKRSTRLALIGGTVTHTARAHTHSRISLYRIYRTTLELHFGAGVRTDSTFGG